MDLGLERVTRLLEALAPAASPLLPPPHLAFPIIHVAGTNGKGSICAYLSSILTASGFRVGRYNSPHLITPRDTIQINNKPISQEDYEFVTQVVHQKDAELNLKATSFELLTATAFYFFAYGTGVSTHSPSSSPTSSSPSKVDIAIIEVGVGGRLDATNIVPRPKVCVIASIGMDHAGLLGNTIEEVAFEKAGIIKAGAPVVVAPQHEGEKVYRVIQEKAAQLTHLPDQIIRVQPASWLNQQEADKLTPPSPVGRWAVRENGYRFWIPLLGDFQLENATTAIAAINVLKSSTLKEKQAQWSDRITDETIRQGIRNTVWPGRLQWIEGESAPREVQGRVLVDGAHNPAAAIALRTYVDEYISELSSVSPTPRIHWIMAFTTGKNVEEMFDILFSKTSKRNSGVERPSGGDTFSAVEFSAPEGMPWVTPIPAQEVCDRLEKQQERTHLREEDRIRSRAFGGNLKAAFEWVGQQRRGDDVVVVCGSLYLVADLFRL
ncbi:folylpolyglutamate synthase [Mortierella hygrophila]|uniref:Folylpolyglutamate synthase n=1 Tax=Mortierella hygrophila TaxID=979708 RepID=A0A9P6FD00_9FUNG|nr:folylpolyglutamate synthase [Mortierella hygrophila]